jgi:osmoprotectant transport system permease protein
VTGAARAAGALALVLLAGAPAAAEPALRVASKSFTESVVLGELATLLAQAAGSAVEHRRALGGTRLVWEALVRGDVDVYPDYSGTLLQEILAGQQPPPGADPLAWLRAELRGRGLGLIGPLGFNNSYAIGLRADVADRLGVHAISDLVRFPGLRLGFSSEFMSRHDGWPGLRDRYQLPQQDVRGLEHDLAYRALADGSLDAIDLYATDAEIRYYRLRVLADDRHHFPEYQALLVHRLDARARHPAAFAALDRLAGAISATDMIALNARVKLDRADERQAAGEWLQRRMGIAPAARAGAPRRRGSLWRTTAEHLQLTGVSLLAAIAVALPLGILSARRRRLGQVVLAAVGIVQTVPSLALLVFMIPLLGIGTLPAIVALFLYSLLPIVRNTHSGLSDIPTSMRESAVALGLTPWAMLTRIELPLCTRPILAGIKSAAVINVGTATLGALVGAGGYGQPIFTGIRLDDVGLILSGAIPASLLALAVQGAFDLLERFALPRGLRLPAG